MTFVAPASEPKAKLPGDLRTFGDLKGAWSGINLSFEDIKASEYTLPEDLL